MGGCEPCSARRGTALLAAPCFALRAQGSLPVAFQGCSPFFSLSVCVLRALEQRKVPLCV